MSEKANESKEQSLDEVRERERGGEGGREIVKYKYKF